MIDISNITTQLQKKSKNSKSLHFVANFLRMCYNDIEVSNYDRKSRVFRKIKELEG